MNNEQEQPKKLVPGHMWEAKEDIINGFDLVKKGTIFDIDEGQHHPKKVKSFIEHFKFIPQNNVEQAAVEVKEWADKEAIAMLHPAPTGFILCDVSHSLLESTFVTYKQWKKTRKAMGLSWKVKKAKAVDKPWLDGMPPAKAFTLKWLACDEDKIWYEFEKEPEKSKGGFFRELKHYNEEYPFYQVSLEMPTLTGDQWKHSKISVAKLQEHQDNTEKRISQRALEFGRLMQDTKPGQAAAKPLTHDDCDLTRFYNAYRKAGVSMRIHQGGDYQLIKISLVDGIDGGYRATFTREGVFIAHHTH